MPTYQDDPLFEPLRRFLYGNFQGNESSGHPAGERESTLPVRAVLFPDRGRGVVANRRLNPGDVIAEIPLDVVVDSRKALQEIGFELDL
ncbi:hypothetical protein HDU93_005982, partial [Gonapodya sp. JEL0774]